MYPVQGNIPPCERRDEDRLWKMLMRVCVHVYMHVCARARVCTCTRETGGRRSSKARGKAMGQDRGVRFFFFLPSTYFHFFSSMKDFTSKTN